jgi:hypothetical protein
MKRELLRSLPNEVLKFKGAKLSKTAVCSFRVLMEDGKHKTSNGGPCHAGLTCRWGYENQTPYAVINQIQSPACGEEQSRRFHEWLLNFSPFSSIVRTKGIKKVWDNRCFVVDADAPANLVAGVCVSSRHTNESYGHNYRRARVWDELVKRGLHPNAAFVVCGMIQAGDDAYKEAFLSDMTHSTLNPGECEKALFPFLEAKPKPNLMDTYAKEKGYGHISATWCYGKTGLRKVLSDTQKFVKEGKKEEDKKRNPFAVEVNDGGGSRVGFNEMMDETVLRVREFIQKEEVKIAA